MQELDFVIIPLHGTMGIVCMYVHVCIMCMCVYVCVRLYNL